jgi:hypothetical protein
MDKIGNLISIAGNAVMMNLLFLAPGFTTLILLLGVNYLYTSGILGSSILLGILFVVAFLPLVLMGQSYCGLLSGIRYNIRGEKWFAGFKKGYTTRFWRGTIAWSIMLAVIIYMLMDLQYAYANVMQGHTSWAEGYLAQLVFAGLIVAMATMVATSLLVLNVYIPTPIGRWVENAVNMVFRVPLELLGSAVLLWLPVLLAVLRFDLFWNTLLIYLALYFSVAALVTTMLLKNGLMQYLMEARADGVLLAEEGRDRSEDDEEDYEDDEDDEYEEEEE